MAADAGELKARATLDNAEFLSALKDMVGQIQQNSEKAAGGIDQMSESFSKMAEAVGAVEIAKKIGEFASECVDAAVQVNKLHAAFDVLAGSQEASNQAFEDLKDLGLNSVFSFADTLGPAAKNMMALGMSASDTTNTMHALVDAAAGLKQGPDWINAVSSTIDGMQARLVASTRDMKSFESEGVDAWGALATQLGVSVSQAQDMVKKGMVTAQQVTDAVTAEMKEQFQGAAELAGTTWTGAMAILENSGEEAKESIGNSILKVLNDFAPVLTTISGLIQDAAKWWAGLSEPVQEVVIAIGAAIPIIVAISAALPILGAALAVIGAAFTGPVAPIVALVAALALIGKWIYDEWPAIKAVFIQLWDDIVATWTSVWTAIGNWLNSNFGGLANGIINIWNGIKKAVGDAIDWIGQKVQQFVGWLSGIVSSVGGFFKSLAGQSTTLNSLSDAWDRGQKAIADNKAAVDANAAALKAHAQQLQSNINQRKQDDAAQLASTNAMKAASAAQSKADADAKKAAEEQKQINESLKKTYDALYAVAPDVAAQFSAMYGGINTNAIDAQKTVGKAWDTMSAATQQMITDTLTLGAAFKTLGETSSASLQGSADKVEAAYTTISHAATSTAGDVAQAFDAVLAANQKLADHNNTDVKDAFTQGKISADDYYDTIIARAQEALDKSVADNAAGLASDQDVAAKRKILSDDMIAQFNAQQTAYTTAMNAIGEKTQEQLSNATDQWNKYAQAIADRLGTDSKQYIEAQIKLTQSLIDQSNALGDQGGIDKYTAQLKGLQTQLESMKTPAQQFADDMKKLGVNTMQDATKGLTDMAAALENARKNSDDSVQSAQDLQMGTDALAKSVQSYIDKLNGPYQQAVKDGKETTVDFLHQAYLNAVQVLDQFVSMGDDVPGKLALVAAATKDVDTAMHNWQVGSMNATEQAFKDLGETGPAATATLKTNVTRDLQAIAAEAGTDSEAYKLAFTKATQDIYDNMVKDGTSLSSGQKEDLAKMEADRATFLENQVSAWGTAYKTIHDSVGGFFDDLTKQIVTGDLSFGKLITKLWQDIADAALNAFLKPVKTAITDFISNELANLLGDKGLGGVLSSLTNIGKSASQVFTATNPSGVAGVVGPPSIPVGGGAASGAASSGSSAAGAAGSAASSVTGIVTAVGGVVSAVSGIISNFQNAKQETTLNAIEHNTRYTMMYVGERADGGILGVLYAIDNELAFGNLVKATENHRDLFKDWSNPALAALQGTADILASWAPYIGDMKDALFDIRTIAQGLGDTINTGFNKIALTVNAGNLTTADAARQLGNQIASNLATQLVAVRG